MIKEQKDEQNGADEEQAEFSLMLPPAVSRKKTPPVEEESVPLWLITFTDIMALMLTFFVLLYSMSTPDENKWEELTTTINQGFSKFYSKQTFEGAQQEINIDKLDFSRALALPYLKTLIEDVKAQDERLGDVVLILQHDRLIISIPDAVLFESGKADMRLTGKRAVYAVGNLLTRIRNRIEVIGHTDPRPISSQEGEFASNWELSLVRAANVAAVLENVGYERHVTVRGLSSARYYDLPEDMSEEDRLSLSRRVDIVVLKDDGSQRMMMQMDGSG